MEPAVTDAVWLKGKQVAFSGQLAAISRAEAVRLVRACGGEVAKSISEDTSYLVVGLNSEPLTEDGRPAPRIRKATQLQNRGLPIQILSEEEFLQRSGVEAPDESRQLYSESHVCRILSIPPERLARWLRAGLVQPCKTHQNVAFFDFQQVSWAKTLCSLTEAGVRPSKIRRSLMQLGHWVDPQDPLAQLTLLEQGGKLLVRLDSGQLAEPHGQPHLDFGEDDCQAAVTVAPLERTAMEWFQCGAALEEAGKLTEAADAYQEALLAGGPQTTTAFNLANVLYQLGQKERAAERFLQAIELDPTYADAWNNLGNIQSELGEGERAVESLKRAVSLSPTCPAYHYNLADMLEDLGRDQEAKSHWRRYLQLEGSGQWAEYARRRVEARCS